MAAGPNHLMGLINTYFGIFSKTGDLEKKINATVWYENVLPTLGPCDRPVSDPLGCAFDPKVVYDHFADRWVMVYLAVNKTTPVNSILVSASDDSDPNGVWCNWDFRGDVNGSTPSGNRADYQGLGFDDQAVYIVPNQFGWDNTFKYAKIRILPKSTLYDPSCPAVTFTDLWDIRYPQPGADAFTVFTGRPAVTFGSPGAEYLMANSGFITPNNNFMLLFTLTTPLSISPVLTADLVTVVPSDPPPDANQSGGGTPLIDVGGHRIRNVVYRDGSVWTAHSVVDSSVATQANARYVRVDVASKTALQDVSIGAANCWYYYPAIAADVDSNMAMVVNRSCTTEFASIRYVSRLNGGALEDSSLLKAGEANYVKTFGGSRNRWGDYSGIAVDPADPRSIWMFAEFADSPANTWSTWFGQVRFPGPSSPALISPADGAVVNTSTPLFDWSDSTGDVVDYLLRATSGDIDNGPFDIDVVVNPVSQYQVTSGEALANASYVWQVTGRNAGAVITASSPTRTFTVTAAPPGPKTLVVTKTGDTADGLCEPTDCSLREAIGSGDSGDTIQVPAGVYTLSLGTELVIDTNLTITGDGPDQTIIQATAAPETATFRVFDIKASGDNVAISDVVIRHGYPDSGSGHGGAIQHHEGGTLTVTGSVISDNTANCGGGISNSGGGTVTVVKTTVNGNTSTSCGGGGLINHQNATGAPRNVMMVSDSTVSGNHSGNPGGGIWNGGTLDVTNSTVSGNTAQFGGALYNFSGSGNQNAVASLSSSTVSGNSGTSSKGGLWNNKTIELKNTVLAGNTAPSSPDCNSFTSLGHNLIGNNSGCSFTPIIGDLVNVAPLLGSLADNGGPTLTHALLPGSPAIDAGDNAAAPATDQRGEARPVDGDLNGVDVADIGAFEFVPSAPPGPKTLVVTKTGDTADGLCEPTDCSLREAIGSGDSGDTIEVPAGTYTLSLGTELVIDTNLTITGDGPDQTIIQADTSSGSATSRVFMVTASGDNVAFSGVTIRHSKSANGGGILNTGTVTLTNSNVSGNTVDCCNGGGIYNIGTGATLTLTDSTVSGNTANGSHGGGIANNSGTVTLNNSTLSGNAAAGHGGGIWNGGIGATMTMANSTVSGNTSSLDGGGINNTGTFVTLTNSTISGNIAADDGGGIWNGSILSLANTIAANNTSSGDCSGPITSLGHNLIGDNSGCILHPHHRGPGGC